jgi:hypothetical protein
MNSTSSPCHSGTEATNHDVIDNILPHICSRDDPRIRQKLIVPADNPTSIVSESAGSYVTDYFLRTVLDPSQSPDLAPCNLFPFNHLKITVQEMVFPSVENLVNAVVQSVIAHFTSQSVCSRHEFKALANI